MEKVFRRRRFLELTAATLGAVALGNYALPSARPVQAASLRQEVSLPNPIPDMPVVQPWLVYPADQIQYPEYLEAIPAALKRVQRFFFDQVGSTFSLEQLKTVISRENYATMRCGPGQECLTDPGNPADSAWQNALLAVRRESYPDTTSIFTLKNEIDVIIFVGGGAIMTAGPTYTDRSVRTSSGYIVVGDYNLEAISGRSNEWGVNCSFNPYGSTSWSCNPDLAIYDQAHELGHSLGLPHPDSVSAPITGRSIMTGDMESRTFAPEEIAFLQTSPVLWVTSQVG